MPTSISTVKVNQQQESIPLFNVTVPKNAAIQEDKVEGLISL
jgi:hypothetical protein